MRSGRMIRASMTWGLALTAVGLTGCVQRTIDITSKPSGALVHLNDKAVGRTPLTVPFTFYGTYDVRLEHDGYKPLWTSRKTDAPFWEAPGPDLIAEMVPHLHTTQHWNFVMQPATPPAEVNTKQLLRRADQLRTRVREGR